MKDKKIIFGSLVYPVLHGNKFVQEYLRFSEVIVTHVSLLQNSKCPEVKFDLIFETSTPNYL